MRWRERHKLLVAMLACTCTDFRPSDCGREYYWRSGSASDGTTITVFSSDATAKRAELLVDGLKVCGASRLFAHLAGIKTGELNSILREACNVPIGDWHPGTASAAKGRAREFWMNHPVLGRLEVKTWDITGEDAKLYFRGKSISGACGLYDRITLRWSGAQKRVFKRELIAKPAAQWTRLASDTFETTWRGDKIKVWRIGNQHHITVADSPLHHSSLESMQIWRHVCRQAELGEAGQTCA